MLRATFDAIDRHIDHCTEGEGYRVNIRTSAGFRFCGYDWEWMDTEYEVLLLTKDDAPAIYIPLQLVESIEVAG